MRRSGDLSGASHADAPTTGYRRYLPAVHGGGRVGTGAGRPFPTDDGPAAEPVDSTGTVLVGVIDTGLVTIGGIHPYLAGRATPLRELDDEDPAPGPDPKCTDQYGHGTFVAGVILRNAPSATVKVRRALLDDDEGNGGYEDAQVVEAIGQLVDAGALVINMSFQGVDPEGDPETPRPPLRIQDAMQVAAEAGVLFVAAAGNRPENPHFFPAEFADPRYDTNPDCPLSDHVVAVTAVDESISGPEADFAALLPPYASFGYKKPWIHGAANGVNVLGPWAGASPELPETRRWARSSGSSFATAIATGRIVEQAIRGGTSPLEAARVLGLIGERRHDPVYLLGADSPGCPAESR